MAWGAPLSVLAVVVIALLWRRDQRRTRRTRAAFFDDCLALFEAYRITQDSVAYPVLEGTRQGARVRLEPVVDHLTWRKLPCLWIKVTVFRDNPYGGVFDFMVRPRGNECFSPIADLHHSIACPPAWPQDASIRTDDPARMPPLALIEPHIGLFDNPSLKELVVTARGVRLVMLAAQARRANYAVARQIDLGAARLGRADAERLMSVAKALAEGLASGAPVLQAA